MECMFGANLLGFPCGLWAALEPVINVLSGPMPSPAGHVDVCGCRKVLSENLDVEKPSQTSVHLMTTRNFEPHFADRENKAQKSQGFFSSA